MKLMRGWTVIGICILLLIAAGVGAEEPAEERPEPEEEQVAVEVQENEQPQNREGLSLIEAVEIALDNSSDIILSEFSLREAEIAQKEIEARPEEDVSREELIQAERNLRDRKENVERTRYSLGYEVMQKYIDVLQDEQSLAIRETELEDAQRELEVGKRRVDAGLATAVEMDLAGLELAVERAESRLDQAETNLETTRMRFNQVLGRDLNTSFELSDDMTDYSSETYALDESITTALANRREIRQAEEDLEDAKKDRDLLTADMASPVELERAEMDVERAQIALEQARENVTMDVRSAYFDYQRTLREIDFEKRDLARAERQLELAERRYEDGYISLGELQSRRRSVERAENSVSQAIYSFKLAAERFLQSRGEAYGPVTRIQER